MTDDSYSSGGGAAGKPPPPSDCGLMLPPAPSDMGLEAPKESPPAAVSYASPSGSRAGLAACQGLTSPAVMSTASISSAV